MATTPLQALPVPSLSDPPNGPAQFSAFGNAVEKQIVMRYLTVAARDAAVIAPVAGMIAYVVADDTFYFHNGTAWSSSRYVPRGATVILTDAAQSIPTGAVTDITWGTEVSDPDGWTSGGSATLTVPAGKGGLYHVCFAGLWAAAGGASNGAQCLLNGVGTYATQDSALWNIETVTFVRTLGAGDTLKFQVFQNSAGAVNINSRLEIAPG